MIGSEILFDTNAFIAWSKAESKLKAIMREYSVHSIAIFSVAELIFGVRKSGKPRENLETLRRRLGSFRILTPDFETADVYADITLAIRRKGRPIPVNDVWIGASAAQLGIPVLTQDAHFDEIDGIKIISW